MGHRKDNWWINLERLYWWDAQFNREFFLWPTSSLPFISYLNFYFIFLTMCPSDTQSNSKMLAMVLRKRGEFQSRQKEWFHVIHFFLPSFLPSVVTFCFLLSLVTFPLLSYFPSYILTSLHFFPNGISFK